MCGRYALGFRIQEVRSALENDGIEVDETSDREIDNTLQPNYNIAPGNRGLICLAPKLGSSTKLSDKGEVESALEERADKEITSSDEFKLQFQIMKWGLIPFWTKRMPDYGTLLKTINCRDDSLKLEKGFWKSMRNAKRCIIIAQGFFEWLKKTEKIPHFIKRKDGKLLYLAGLYDCVEFEDTKEKLSTYTIITTNSNQQMDFLHDRMPVILKNGSDDIRKWLDPNQLGWTDELQTLLKPFDGDLEIYPVSKDIGKLSKNFARLIIPIDSSENKSNIANFFSKGDSNASLRLSDSMLKNETNSEVFDAKTSTKAEEIAIEASTTQLPQDYGLGHKRKLSVQNDHEQRKIINQGINNKFNTNQPVSQRKMKSSSSNNTPKPQKSSGKRKENLKITNFFK